MLIRFIKRWLGRGARSSTDAVIIPRAAHGISRRQIPEHALKVLYRLHNAGFDAYLVGGCVRDLLLGLPPKDFDVVTNATPEQVRGLFRNARVIGRRFRLVHVTFGREIIEVATFRAGHSHTSEHGVVLRDNEYSASLKEDAFRRDFTLNGLYYNIADFSIIDYVGGMADIQSRTLRMIGEAKARYREDPVRMLRAVRFASQKGVVLAPETAAGIQALAELMTHAAPARLFEELFKLFLNGKAWVTFQALYQSPLFPYLFPAVYAVLEKEPHHRQLLNIILHNTDQRYAADKPVTLGFVLSGIFWPVVVQMQGQLFADQHPYDAWMMASDAVFQAQNKNIHVPKRMQQWCEDIWWLQQGLSAPHPRKVRRIVEDPRFRAAYDFFALRYEAGEQYLQSALEWWTRFQEVDFEAQEIMREKLGRQPRRRS